MMRCGMCGDVVMFHLRSFRAETCNGRVRSVDALRNDSCRRNEKFTQAGRRLRWPTTG